MAHQRKRDAVAIGSVTVSVMRPRVLVWVRTGSRDWRDRWHRLSQRLGLGYHADAPVQVLGNGWVTVFDVWGTPQALEDLTSGRHAVIERWEYACTAPGVYRPSGVGECKRHESTTDNRKYHLRTWSDRERVS